MSTHDSSSRPASWRRGWKEWPEWKLVLGFVLLMFLVASAISMVLGGFFAMATQSGYGSKDPAGIANDRHFLVVAIVMFFLSLCAFLALQRSENHAPPRADTDT